MTWFDGIVIAIIAFSMCLGLFRGLVKEVLSIVNLILAFWIANRFGGDLVVDMEWAQGFSPSIQALMGCAIAFFAVMLIGAIAISFLTKVVSAAGLGFVDRGLGVFFGFGRGSLIVLVAVAAAGFTSLPSKPFWKEAALSPMAVSAIVYIKHFVPEPVAKWIRY